MSVINATPLLAAAGGDYQISRSVRLRSSASANLTRTPSGSGNRTTWTWSSWIKRGNFGGSFNFFGADSGIYLDGGIVFSSDILGLSLGGNVYNKYSTAVLRDPSAWYHIVVVLDTNNATAANRIRFYVNGAELTAYTTQNTGLPTLGYTPPVLNTAARHSIGVLSGYASNYFDGYLTEVNFIDGQALTPSSFGETDSITGVWKPKKYAGTYGTNGFYLNFSDNSSNTATTIGKDYSGNGNNWTPNNISVTSGVTYDSMIDVPTLYADGGNGRGNYAVLNPLLGGVNNAVMTNGNLTATLTYSSQVNTYSNMPLPTTGKWYWESTVVASNYGVNIGIRSTVNSTLISAGSTGGYSYYNANGNKYDGATASAYGTSWYGASRTDVIGVAYDADTRELTFYLNGVSQGVAFTVTAGEYYPAASHVSGSGSHTEHYNFGQRPFAYTPPTGFKALNTQNLPEPTIKKGNQYFDATLYSGNSSSQTVTNSGGMQPDLVWIKSRNVGGNNHNLWDAVRGAGKALFSNLTDAEGTAANMTGFTSSGFSFSGTAYDSNTTGNNLVAWQWKESASSGFDIVTYSGDSTTPRAISHNLGVTPGLVILKCRSNATNYRVYHSSFGTTTSNTLYLNLTNAVSTTDTERVSAVSSSTFTVTYNSGGGDTNTTGRTYVAYLFAEVPGFSRFGSYTGNGSADGPFVFTGFRPRFVMVKRTDAAGENWMVYDTSRDLYNYERQLLHPNSSAAEYTSGGNFVDNLSNGVKIRSSDTALNASGGTYIYAAFAESPFKNSLAR